MANIPVERKSGLPGWIWILLALVLGLLLFLLLGDGCADDVDDTVSPPDTTSYVAPTPAVTPGDDLNITGPADFDQLDSLFARAEREDVIGRSVRLNDVTAYNVTGDSTFYVRSGSNEAFVVLTGLGESQSNMGAQDGRYAVREGDVLDVMGRVRALDEAMRADWTIRPQAAQGYYIEARRLDM